MSAANVPLWLSLARLSDVAYDRDLKRAAGRVMALGWEAPAFFACEISGMGDANAMVCPGDPNVVAFRGTEMSGGRPEDIFANLDTALIKAPRGGHVHRGYWTAVDSIWPAIERDIDRLGGSWVLTGHSMGGAMATVAAYRRPLPLVSFGAPMVGRLAFMRRIGGPIARLVHGHDWATSWPWPSMFYRHPGSTFWHLAPGAGGAPDQSMTLIERPYRWMEPKDMDWGDHAIENYISALAALAAGGGSPVATGETAGEKPA